MTAEPQPLGRVPLTSKEYNRRCAILIRELNESMRDYEWLAVSGYIPKSGGSTEKVRHNVSGTAAGIAGPDDGLEDDAPGELPMEHIRRRLVAITDPVDKMLALSRGQRKAIWRAGAAIDGRGPRACPYCGEKVKFEATTCEHCDRSIPAGDDDVVADDPLEVVPPSGKEMRHLEQARDRRNERVANAGTGDIDDPRKRDKDGKLIVRPGSGGTPWASEEVHG